MNDAVRLTPAQRLALNRVQLQRQRDQERRQFVADNPSIDPEDARAYLQESVTATVTVTQQAQDVLTRTNSHVQTIPSAPADPPLPAAPVVVPPPAAPAEDPPVPPAPVVAPPPPAPPQDEDLPPPPPPPPAPPTVSTGPTPGQSAGNPSASPNPTATAAPGGQPSASQTQTRSGSNAYLDRVLEPFRMRGIEWDIQDNELNQFDRYTYHWRLLMVNDIDASGPRSGDQAQLPLSQQIANNSIPIVVVAESGVTTGFNITNVQILDSVGPNFRTRNTVTTEIDITITEPYGMTLIDRMFLASRQLGIQNWRLAPLILDLSFRVRAADGQASSNQFEPIRKIYKLVLVDTESTLTEVGSTYRIKASADGTLGFKDFWFIIPQTYKVVAGETVETSNSIIRASSGTVGAFFESLGTQLTDFYRDQRNNTRGTSTTPLIFYKFVVAPELAEKEINFNNQTNGRRLGFSVPGSANQEVTIGRGISIADVVDDICASLKDVNFFTPPNSETTGQIRVPRIECTVELLGYDTVLNDYVRQFNYVIGVLETLRPTPTVEHGRRFQTSLQYQTSRTRGTASAGIVRKFYPFYYTGMNTEIIKLDLTFNQLHIISLPLYNGGTLPPAAIGSSITAELPRLQAQYQQLTRTLAENQAAYEQASATANELNAIEQRARSGRLQNSNLSPLETELRNLARRPLDSSAATLPNAEQAALVVGAAQLSEETNLLRIVGERRVEVQGQTSLLAATIQDNQATLGEVSNQILNLQTGAVVFFNPNDPRRIGQTDPRAEQLFRQAQQAREQSRTRQTRLFAEDIPITTYSSPIDFAGLYTYAADPRDIANHLARSATTADNSNEVRGVYTTILAQLYDRQGQHLTEIEMEIRGDPYWLGFSNVERQLELNAYINRLAAAQSGVSRSFGRLLTDQQSSRFANYVDRDASFLLLFRPGDQPNEESGIMEFKDSVYFNGIYHTIEVTHQFSNGQFTQKLRAVRDLININSVRDAPQTSQPTNNQPAAAPASPAAPASTPAAGGTAGEAGTAGAGSPTASATPNASPNNIQASAAASVRNASDVAPDAVPPGRYIRGNSPEAIAQRQADNAIIMRRFDQANNFTGNREGLANLTGEGRLTDPSQSIYQPRQVALSGRPVIEATYNARTNDFENTTANPGETVDYWQAELAAMRANRGR